MKKIGLIVQRYGQEVNGGAEHHCRILAEKLRYFYDLEVLTSCAKNHLTWANEYPEGLTEINGVKVRRFNAPQQRNKSKVHQLVKRLNNRSLLQKIENFFGIKRDVTRLGDEWSIQQGPYLPGLITHLQTAQGHYEVLIFFTYLYFPTFVGLRVAPWKSILIPTAHDEPAIHLPVFESFFKLPKVILYNTLSEKNLVRKLFNNDEIYSDVVGLGIDETFIEDHPTPAEILKTDAVYVIYIGRIDPGKGCDLMIAHFLRYKQLTGDPVKLVLVGKQDMEISAHPDLLLTGFVDESVKHILLSGAKALIMPSHYESLSLVTLESMQHGVPVIANRNCEVLKDHIMSSGAGFTFQDFDTFKFALDSVLNDDEASIAQLQKNARKYVNENYNWDIVLSKFTAAINYISNETGSN